MMGYVLVVPLPDGALVSAVIERGTSCPNELDLSSTPMDFVAPVKPVASGKNCGKQLGY
jgi:hypothetical protein